MDIKLILSQEILDFMRSSDTLLVYTHRTKDEEYAKKVMQKGFEFPHFNHATDMPGEKDEYIQFCEDTRTPKFGDYTIVFGFDKKLIIKYTPNTPKIAHPEEKVFEVLCEEKPKQGYPYPHIYTLPNKFVRGYLNGKKNLLVENPEFKSDYESPIFKKNLERMINPSLSDKIFRK